jgi:hypothetical protein
MRARDRRVSSSGEELTFTYELVSTSRKSRFRRMTQFAALLAIVGGISVWAGFESARRTVGISRTENLNASIGLLDAPSNTKVASPGPPTNDANETDKTKRSQPAIESSGTTAADLNHGLIAAELDRLPVQQRAERLLAAAMQGDQGSLNLLRDNVDGWRGHLKSTERLFDMVLSALNSRDLRVRSAAIDVDLAANNLSKTPQSVARLQQEMQEDPAGIGMCLWRLGALGNRGVEPEKVFNSLLLYMRSRNEHTRYWAVEGLGMLGNNATIDPLLTTMAHDVSPRVRELAASSLGHAGMLTREERMGAVPTLLNFADDDSLSAATRELVYGTLRMITGAELGNDPGAWREWWANHDPARVKPRQRAGLVRA